MGWSNWFTRICACEPREHKEELLLCPRCKKEMTKKSKSGLTIDKCSKCGGIWLDKGEIFKIIGKVKQNK